jgi:hypothetical protein
MHCASLISQNKNQTGIATNVFHCAWALLTPLTNFAVSQSEFFTFPAFLKAQHTSRGKTEIL